MRMLVALPAISYKSASRMEVLKDFLSIEVFEPTLTTLDVFPHEMKGISPPHFWSVNVPHWPMQASGTRGVAGPGKPADELFSPTYLQKTMAPICGKYDKWRPYPAEKPLSNYAVEMAERFSKKRCRMFDKIIDSDMPCETLFYAEHAPASLAHVSRRAARVSAEVIIDLVKGTAQRNPRWELVIFSPYGVGSKPGFVVSNRMDAKHLSNWTEIRKYLNGSPSTSRTPDVPTD